MNENEIQEQALDFIARTSRKGDEAAQNLTDFYDELVTLINKYSQERHSNTPDYLLADYMINCLTAYEKAVTRRDVWHSHFPE